MSGLAYFSNDKVRQETPELFTPVKGKGAQEVGTGKVSLQEERKRMAASKYKEAVTLYASTDMTMQAIARQCGVSACGLKAHLSRHHRALMLARYQISAEGKNPHSVKIQLPKGPTPAAYHKYKEAVEACGTLDYIEYNVSQVARRFGVSGPGLANFMKLHYPDIPVWREKVRRWMGINDNTPRGPLSKEQYAEAVELYRTSEYTVPEVAALCRVSVNGLSQHIRFYYQDVMNEREQLRKRAGERKRGERAGNGKLREPKAETEKKYAEALALYRNTTLTLKEIVAQTGVPMGGFRAYLRTWHNDLVLERSGLVNRIGEKVYAEAIAELKAGKGTTESVAKAFGFCPETFRDYLYKHEPELAKALGRMQNRNGRQVSCRSEKKYAEAIRIYETTPENLKSIAQRLGLVYNSLGGYVRRNYPDAIRRHEDLVKKQEQERK